MGVMFNERSGRACFDEVHLPTLDGCKEWRPELGLVGATGPLLQSGWVPRESKLQLLPGLSIGASFRKLGAMRTPLLGAGFLRGKCCEIETG